MELAIWLIIIPLLTAFSLGLIRFLFKKYYKELTLIANIVYFILVIIVVKEALKEPIVYNIGAWDSLVGINLIIDSFSAIFLLLIALLSLLVLIYSFQYIKKNEFKYYVLYSLLLVGVTGMVTTGDLFNLFVFFEITSITSYALTAIKEEDKSIEGAFKYLLLGTISGGFILLAIIITYQSLGTLNLPLLAQNFAEVPSFLKQLTLVLYLVGFATKFALIPLHTWLPDAYPQAPVSFNVLSSGLVIKASFYALIRILYLFFGVDFISNTNLGNLLIYWGVVTFLVAHTVAYQQDNIKRLLGYSSIAQMGYIIVGFGLATELGVIAGSYHLINHAIMKGALFLAVGIFIYYLNNQRIEQLRGSAYLLPFTSLIFVIGSLAIVGLPPFNGFISKWLLIQASLEAGHIIAAFAIPVGSLLSLTYYLKAISALYSKPVREEKRIKPSWRLKLPTLVLGFLCLFLGLAPDLLMTILEKIPEFLLESSNYIDLLL